MSYERLVLFESNDPAWFLILENFTAYRSARHDSLLFHIKKLLVQKKLSSLSLSFLCLYLLRKYLERVRVIESEARLY